jgi:hypothetical protein
MVDPSLAALSKVLKLGMATGDVPSVVRAALGILDRTGFAPGMHLKIDDPRKALADLLGVPVEMLSMMEAEQAELVAPIPERWLALPAAPIPAPTLALPAACSVSNERQAGVCLVTPLDPDTCSTSFLLGDCISPGEPAAATIDPEHEPIDSEPGPDPADLDEEEFDL